MTITEIRLLNAVPLNGALTDRIREPNQAEVTSIGVMVNGSLLIPHNNITCIVYRSGPMNAKKTKQTRRKDTH